MSDITRPAFSRRMFLQQGMAFISLASTAPLFIQRSAHGVMIPFGSLLSSFPGVPEDHVLVVVQLGGGNDGLNTVVPFGDPAYYRARSNIAVPEPGKSNGPLAGALKLDDKNGIGLNANL